jgi:glutamine synthetase
MPWHKDEIAQVLITIQDDSRYNSTVDPRNLLAQVWNRFGSLKLKVKVAFELEFYLIAKRKNLSEITIPAVSKRTGKKSEGTQVYSMNDLDDFYDFLEDVNEYCKVQDIPASTASSEFAPGQFEINLNYTDNILKAADDASLLRRVIKETAIKHEYEATFLSKPFLNEAGSGMHVHISLFDEDNKNIFSKNDNTDTKELYYAIGGLQNMMFDSFAFFASNQNAYRRFEPDIFVPVNTSWGHNNRSVAFRIPVSDNKAKRIEHRVAGAEANAYLVLSSILSGIEDGLVNKLKATDPRVDNACVDPDPKMPKNIEEALAIFESSDLMKKYLTEEYVKIFVELKRKEQSSFKAEISDIEYKWYLNL